MSDSSIQRIFRARCYDETEDDPWMYLTSPSQDFLPADLKPLRVLCAKHILDHVAAGAWYNMVAIDPCYSLLPLTLAKLEEQQTNAMGKMPGARKVR